MLCFATHCDFPISTTVAIFQLRGGELRNRELAAATIHVLRVDPSEISNSNTHCCLSLSYNIKDNKHHASISCRNYCHA